MSSPTGQSQKRQRGGGGGADPVGLSPGGEGDACLLTEPPCPSRPVPRRPGEIALRASRGQKPQRQNQDANAQRKRQGCPVPARAAAVRLRPGHRADRTSAILAAAAEGSSASCSTSPQDQR